MRLKNPFPTEIKKKMARWAIKRKSILSLGTKLKNSTKRHLLTNDTHLVRHDPQPMSLRESEI